MAHFCARVRKRKDLPQVAMKDIYRCPTVASLAADLAAKVPAPAADATAPSLAKTQSAFAEILAGVMRVESVEASSHFFEDLGADSLVMAHFCARVRKRKDLPQVAMKDIYRCPTIASLAADLAAQGAGASG